MRLPRLITLLLHLAVAFAMVAASVPASASPKPAVQAARCCGRGCACSANCPCASGDRSAPRPSDDAPAAPAPQREQRAALLQLPYLVATLTWAAPRGSCASGPNVSHEPAAHSGRAILELVSRWTT